MASPRTEDDEQDGAPVDIRSRVKAFEALSNERRRPQPGDKVEQRPSTRPIMPPPKRIPPPRSSSPTLGLKTSKDPVFPSPSISIDASSPTSTRSIESFQPLAPSPASSRPASPEKRASPRPPSSPNRAPPSVSPTHSPSASPGARPNLNVHVSAVPPPRSVSTRDGNLISFISPTDDHPLASSWRPSVKGTSPSPSFRDVAPDAGVERRITPPPNRSNSSPESRLPPRLPARQKQPPTQDPSCPPIPQRPTLPSTGSAPSLPPMSRPSSSSSVRTPSAPPPRRTQHRPDNPSLSLPDTGTRTIDLENRQARNRSSTTTTSSPASLRREYDRLFDTLPSTAKEQSTAIFLIWKRSRLPDPFLKQVWSVTFVCVSVLTR
jgi:hypothetical protein